METTTVKFSRSAATWWKKSCKVKKMSSVDMSEKFMEVCQLKQQHEFYLEMAMPSNYKKILAGVHIDKSRVALKVYGK